MSRSGNRGKAFYAGQEVEFDLPGSWNVLAMAEPRAVSEVPDLAVETRRALLYPIGTKPLAELVSPGKRVAIISEDQTRPSPIGKVVVPLLDELHKLGIPDSAVDVVIGRGTHRATTREELLAKLGSEVLERVRVSVHDADDKASLVYLGKTSRGTPAWVNRTVAEADLKIGIGTINPHYFAGYSGGPKIVLPGISGRDTIRTNHVWIRDPNTVQGKMDGNPIWEDMLEVARLLRLSLLINFLLTPSMGVYGLFAGEVEKAQKAAVEAFKGIYGVPVARPSDVTITSAYPLEVDLIQSGKSILSADAVTRPGGTIILSSACPDGTGPMYYETLKERPTPEEVVEWIDKGRASPTGGPMASRVRRLLQTKKLVVVTGGVGAEKLADMEMDWAGSMEEAIAKVSAQYPRADVTILPVGGATFPYIANEN